MSDVLHAYCLMMSAGVHPPDGGQLFHQPRLPPGLGSSTVDQVLKYTKYPKYIPSTSTGQVLIFLKST